MKSRNVVSRNSPSPESSISRLFEFVSLLVSNPRSLVKSQLPKASWKNAFYGIALFSVIVILYSWISMLFSLGQMPNNLQVMAAVMSIVVIFLYPILLTIGVSLITVVEYGLLKVFRGRGTFEQLFHMIAKVYLPTSVIFGFIVGLVLSFVSRVFTLDLSNLELIFIYSIVAMILKNSYPLIILTIILEEVGKLNRVKAILCGLIPSLILIAMWGGVMFLSLQLMKNAGITEINVEGFEVVKPALDSLVFSSSPDKSSLTLSLTDKGEDVVIKKSGITVTKNGQQCLVDSISTFGFDDFGSPPSPKDEVVLRKNMPTWFIMDVSGAGCGGISGDEYTYSITMKLEQGGMMVDNSGTLIGKYTGNSITPNQQAF